MGSNESAANMFGQVVIFKAEIALKVLQASKILFSVCFALYFSDRVNSGWHSINYINFVMHWNEPRTLYAIFIRTNFIR